MKEPRAGRLLAKDASGRLWEKTDYYWRWIRPSDRLAFDMPWEALEELCGPMEEVVIT